MRLLHTSDWHLGRAFHGVGLGEAHALYLDHVVEVCAAEGVDALLIAGDVYDRAIPSPDSVELLSDAIARVRAAGTQVVISAGNHDSARRLSFGARVMESAGVHIRTGVEDLARPVVVRGTPIYPLPYLDPMSSSVLDGLGVTTRSHAAVLGAAVDRVRADMAERGPGVLAAHCFATGAVASDSERDITCGGVAAVPADLFAGFGYVALGHLHRPQEVAPGIRYSGSPVPMSFSEAGQRKVSLLVDLPDGGAAARVTSARVTAVRDAAARVTAVEAPLQRPLAVVRGDLEELLVAEEHRGAEGSYVQAVLTDPLPPRAPMERLRARFPHTLSVQFDPQGAPVPVARRARAVRGRSPLEVCRDFVADIRHGHPASAAESALLTEAVEGSRTLRAERRDEGQTASRGPVPPTRSEGVA